MRAVRDIRRQYESGGFTLVELMVALIIGVFVAMVAVGTLKSISGSSEVISRHIDVSAEVKFAASRIAHDLTNIYRNSDYQKTKFIATVESSGQGFEGTILTFYAVGRAKARPMEKEGDIYEVEYSLVKEDKKSVLMRRLWPNPDKERQPGGVMMSLAEDIEVFQARFFDGEMWLNEWTEEMNRLPKLVEITIAARIGEGKEVIGDKVLLNFASAAGVTDDSSVGLGL